MGFISSYNGDTWESRLIHAVLNTVGIWGVMLVGQLAFVERLNDGD